MKKERKEIEARREEEKIKTSKKERGRTRITVKL
jgi:hypothetical protein